LKINNSLDHARWESIPCGCGKDVMDSFPIKDCLHCKFDQAWQSVPQKNFETNDDLLDEDGTIIAKRTRVVKEVTLVRGSKYEDVIGWTF
tara:strand:+ start:610 stop:879 length:270 start_codon:yes stop_codon:yes gene_type:complete